MEAQHIDRGDRSAQKQGSSALGRLLREPLVHFVLLAACVFVLYRTVSASTPDERAGRSDRTVISVDRALREELGALYDQQHDRKPTPEELDQAVDAWVEDEMLFRTGLTIVEEDPGLRLALIMRMRARLRPQEQPRAPQEPELRTYFEAHRADFTKRETVSFTEYQLPTTPDANERGGAMLLALQRGELSNTPAIHYPLRTELEIASVHGDTDAKRITALPLGEWRLLQTERGLMLLRIDERTPAREPSFDEVRDTVADAFVEASATREVERQMASIRARYVVRVTESAP